MVPISFANSHPELKNKIESDENRVTACSFCNVADNKFVPILPVNLDFKMMVKEAFRQKKDRKLKVREEYREWWKTNIEPKSSLSQA